MRFQLKCFVQDWINRDLWVQRSCVTVGEVGHMVHIHTFKSHNNTWLTCETVVHMKYLNSRLHFSYMACNILYPSNFKNTQAILHSDKCNWTALERGHIGTTVLSLSWIPAGAVVEEVGEMLNTFTCLSVFSIGTSLVCWHEMKTRVLFPLQFIHCSKECYSLIQTGFYNLLAVLFS